jgi:hypothetical protein
MQVMPITKWHTEIGHVKVDILANPHRDRWNDKEVRHHIPVSFGLGKHPNGDPFLQIWLCPPWMLNEGTKAKSLIIIDERLGSCTHYEAFIKAQAALKEDPHAFLGMFPQNAWDYFWSWFTNDADARLVQMSNGAEVLVLEEGTAWMWDRQNEPVYLLHGHMLTENHYDSEQYTIDRKADEWSWELTEEIYNWDHNLYRVSLTTDSSPELITVTREDREDIYEEDPNASEDSCWPFTDKYETVYHKHTFKLTLGSTYQVSEVPSETQEEI